MTGFVVFLKESIYIYIYIYVNNLLNNNTHGKGKKP